MKGQDSTRLHAFVNCQAFKLTANRGSVENTSAELLADIEESVRAEFDTLMSSDDWTNIDWLEEEGVAAQTVLKERKNYQWRLDRIRTSNIASFSGLTLVEPKRESGVFSIFMMLSTVKPDLFPFAVVDYDTHEGIDVIAKGDKTTPLVNSKLFYIEFKHTLEKSFNHSFENLHSVICWETSIKNDEEVVDINKETRKLSIVAPKGPTDCTSYFLDNPQKAHKIPVYVLKDYLKQKLNLSFRPRTKDDAV